MLCQGKITVINKTLLNKRDRKQVVRQIEAEFGVELTASLGLGAVSHAKLNGAVSGYMYCVFDDKQPLFTHTNKKIEGLTPTVYALARVADLLPSVEIQRVVVSKLARGDKLFRPGAFQVRGQVRKGSMVALFCEGHVVGVAKSNMDLSEILACSTGLLATPIHMVGDELYLIGSRSLDVDVGDDSGEEDEQEAQESESSDPSVRENPDTLALNEFLTGLRRTLVAKTPLPLLLSTFASQYFEGNVKKSSFKKLSVLARHIGGLDVCTIEETSPGVLSITSIEKSSATLKSAPKPEPIAQEALPGSPVVIEQLYKVHPSLCKKLGFPSRPLRAAELRQEVREMLGELSKGVAAPDNPLVEALGVGAHLKDVVAEVMHKRTRPFHRITVAGGNMIENSGPPPSIAVREERRGGNKTVTLIGNVEAFGLRCQDVASFLAKKFAGSASVGEDDVILLQGKRMKDSRAAICEEYHLTAANFSDAKKQSKKNNQRKKKRK